MSIEAFSVLNPHGSDETCDPLLSATCRADQFLTHTVQMKHILFDDCSIHLELVLNPHGSDETCLNLYLRKNQKSVLNPHGSDETRNHYF